ncbi:reverse transcriptase domain-containing protein, partial [Klebsiella pneumoniae]|uniref:reverse transcriptase domain-containing protein n=1 Tax=Klebsiella pneumoniae TaxID=573 RepID=UPI003A80A783
MTSIRILLSIACNLDWPLFQFDVQKAFLQGELEEDIYMSLPPGHPLEGSGKLCHLKKAIYSLKQSPRAWYSKLSQALSQAQFSKCKCDHSIFLRKRGSLSTIVLIYVDDIIITGSDKEGIEKIKFFLKQKFDIKDLGKIKYFLGIEFARSNKGLPLSQRKFASDILKEFKMLNCNPIDSPVDPNSKLDLCLS